MKRSPPATRSYLRQLAEPVPHLSAVLIPRPPHERGASGRSAVDAIPVILDSVLDRGAATATPHHRPARSTTENGRSRTPRSRILPVEFTTQHELEGGSDSATHIEGTTKRTSPRDQQSNFNPINKSEDPSPSGITMRENPPSRKFAAPRNDAAPQGEDHKQLITQIPSTSTRGIRVHIGTVEVRTNPPVREPKPAPAFDRNTRIRRPGSVAEPLSRGLAWSHGLVQG